MMPNASVNKESIKDKELPFFVALVLIFGSCLVVANITAFKMFTIAGLVVPAGVFAYSITFMITDVVSEVWGRRYGQLLVYGGLLVLLVQWLLVWLAISLPPVGFWGFQEEFQLILAAGNRIVIASAVTFIISQSLDVWVFHKLRNLLAGRHLWLRNNASTIVSQLVDTTIFITIAFYGVFPIMPAIIGQFTVKLIIALCDTPLVYGLVYLIRNSSGSKK